MSKKLTIGIFGFGVVGQGLYDIISTKDLNIEIRKIVIKDPQKTRSLPADLFTTDAAAILNDREINTVIELINDADAAYQITKTALSAGKNVVSANKKMVAEHLAEFVELQIKYDVSLLYEGAVCGSIPIIRNLEEYYDNELLHSVSGIFNGSSNYILSKIRNEGFSYADALTQAQQLGFAETDPTMDVGGYDAKYKLLIAAAHAYGLVARPDDIFNAGISALSAEDIQLANDHDLKIKLIPTAKKTAEDQVALYVLPKFVASGDFLYNVENEYNAVSVKAAFADQQLFYGKGAGGHPTGSAVLSDIAALRYDYRYEYKKFHQPVSLKLNNDEVIPVYLRCTDPDVLQNIRFESVISSDASGNSNVVIGRIKLSELMEKKHILDNDNAFIAEASELIALNEKVGSTESAASFV